MGRSIAVFIPIFLAVARFPGCGSPHVEPAKTAAPAKVEKIPGEADLTTITLTPAAEARLGIATAVVERKEVPWTRTLGGEVVIPPGRAIAVSAPVSGTLRAPEGGVPTPGTPMKAGQVVFRLLPLLSPEARTTLATTRVEAQGQVEQAQKQVAQAELLLDRAERLRRDNLGGSGAVEDARAQSEVAAATLKAATSRRDALDQTIRGVEGGMLEPIPIAAEADGMLRNVLASAGQMVAAGSLLFDVVSLDPARIRVPVYVGDLRDIDEEVWEVAVGGLADPPGGPARAARRVAAPPSGDPLAATVDLFYDVPNADEALRPGQRVGVTLTLRSGREGLVVPSSAVLRDIDGGAWVYEAIGTGKYARRRVRVDRVVGADAVLSAGPGPGTKVVTDGAAELFGTEFGGLK